MKVKGFEHYELDPVEGTLYNSKMNRFLPQTLPYRIDSEGNKVKDYVNVRLSDGKRKRTVKLHILMAEAFIPNPDGKSEVHHINHDIHDNRVSNLCWATRGEQMDPHWKVKHSKQLKSIQNSRATAIRVFKEGFSQEYISIHEASRDLGVQVSNLHKVLNGERNTTGGYKAEYLEEHKNE